MDRIFAYIQFTENASLEAADSMEVQPPSHPARKEPESEKNYHCQILFLFRERLWGGGGLKYVHRSVHMCKTRECGNDLVKGCAVVVGHGQFHHSVSTF